MTLYALTITDTEMSYDNYSEDFGIGIFSSYEKAVKIAQKYLQTIAGFCEYPCTYQIKEKTIADAKDVLPEFVWMCSGYNVNKNMDEIDIVESDCYISEKEAQLAFESMKERFYRTVWTLNCFQIDRQEWQEGFCRA